MILVTGGAASGKSELAEQICIRLGGRMLYIATMRPYGDGAAERIARHRAARAGRGFATLEWYEHLERAVLPQPCDTVLLECLGNLVANQIFEARTPPGQVVQTVVAGVQSLAQQAGQLVVVTNEVFSGAEQYQGEMAVYMHALAGVNRQVAQRADTVVESVCGLAHILKGELQV